MKIHPPIISCLRLLAVAVLLTLPEPACSQNSTKSFTIENGLPSNLIYSFAQDKRGFLWIATDNGLARFDGKYFKVYNTVDGLPDNEILEVISENDGTIWVNTFKQGPCYYDERTDRFIDPLKGLNVNRDLTSLVIYVRALDDGGIVFFNVWGEFVFKNKKLVRSPVPRAYSFKDGNGLTTLSLKSSEKKRRNFYAYYNNHRGFSDSVPVFSSGLNTQIVGLAFLDSSRLYVIGDQNKLYSIRHEGPGKKFIIDSVRIPEKPVFFRLNGKRLSVSTNTGKIFVYNKNDLQEHYSLEDQDIFYNCVFEDNQKNIWAGTLQRGMMIYKLNFIETLDMMPGVSETNCMSVLATMDGKIYAGTYFGEVFEKHRGEITTHLPNKERGLMWIRQLVSIANKVFVISEPGCFASLSRLVKIGDVPLTKMKTAAVLNDSILVVGGVNSYGSLFKINAITEKAEQLNCPLIRVSEIETMGGRFIYCGTNDGLYKYDYQQGTMLDFPAAASLKSKRVLSVSATSEGLLCVSTASDGMYIIKNDRVISKIDNSLLGNSTVTSVTATPGSIMWVGTRNGLSKIDYSLQGDIFRFKVNNFSVVEGLPANSINDIAWRNDSIFVATLRGVAYLPAELKMASVPINTYLTKIIVNEKHLPLSDNNIYRLQYDERTIMLEFGGVNLGGHLKSLQYTFNRTQGWTNIDADDLSLELSPGDHTLFVRSLDTNGNANGQVLTLRFEVNRPFYRSVWFAILVAALVAGVIVFMYYRSTIARQKREWEQQSRIEEERSRITADLHDEIGSTLSSLQIYSDVAYDVVDKNKEDAKELLKQITTKASKISENIADIIWSMKANDQYTMGPESRIKNIVSEMLGPTDIKYSISIDPEADTFIHCIVCRKNLILIVKEAINNVVKYSEASMVKVALIRKGDRYTLSVEDNGKGMDTEQSVLLGNGLKNMKRRCEEIGGEFIITSAKEQGTCILARIPVTKFSGAPA